MIAPESADAVAEIVGRCARERRTISVRGGGTKWDWFGGGSRESDIVLSTSRLDRIVAHRHGDLTATVEAGARLDDVNRELARRGQWIPLDPAWADRATIGGIVATNDAGPRRHRYGSPRDLIIGIEIVRADGVRAKAGGIVVKNVAGYDLSRLMAGSFGCLGVIVAATFKLYPISASSRTLVVTLRDAAAISALVGALSQSPVTPAAVEIAVPPARLLVRFESTSASTEHQSVEAVRLASMYGEAAVLAGEEEAALWRAHEMRPWSAAGTIAKLALLPSDISGAIHALEAAASDSMYELVGRAGIGALLLRLDGPPASQARAIEALRSRTPPGRGSLVVVRAADAVRALVDAWGPMGDAFPIMRAVKQSLDPDGILNPGRGPGAL